MDRIRLLAPALEDAAAGEAPGLDVDGYTQEEGDEQMRADDGSPRLTDPAHPGLSTRRQSRLGAHGPRAAPPCGSTAGPEQPEHLEVLPAQAPGKLP